MGSPDPKYVSTSYIERAVALYSVRYNFVRVHKTLWVTPAMAANVSDRLWSMEDMAEMIDTANAKPAAKRGPYNKNVKSA